MGDTPAPVPAPAPRPVVVIRRKRAAGHGHHGGAWKVAYADFVTAMMALFIVLWLMSSDEDVQKAIASYFNNPSGPGTQTGTAAAGAGHSIDMAKEEMSKLRDRIQEALAVMPKFRELKDNVEMTITADGLRIELLESDTGVFFESGQPRPNPTGQELLTRLAEEVGKLPNGVLIEGHTDSKPFPGEEYSNWELSADRANGARKIMQVHGLRPEQIGEVRGYADRRLRRPEDPANASNRRISLLVQYLARSPAAAAADPAPQKPAH
jgi:chemotaxis protein MotB